MNRNALLLLLFLLLTLAACSDDASEPGSPPDVEDTRDVEGGQDAEDDTRDVRPDDPEADPTPEEPAPDEPSPGDTDTQPDDEPDLQPDDDADALPDEDPDADAQPHDDADALPDEDPDASPSNACGGDDALLWEGQPAEVGDACGPCLDGALSCDGEEALLCAQASEPNPCGGCGTAPGTLGEPCDECAVWACELTEYTCRPALLEPECDVDLPTCDSLACEDLGRECEVDVLVGATCGDCLEDFDAVEDACLIALTPPTSLTATTDVRDVVQLSWDAVEGAESYALYVDDERVVEVVASASPSWNDADAPSGTIRSTVGATIQATASGVSATLSAPDLSVGLPVEYRVRALAGERSSEWTEPTQGFRSAPTFLGFERWTGDAWESTDAAITWDAPAPTIVAGTVEASSDDIAGVALEATGFSALPGTEASVTVRAVVRVAADATLSGGDAVLEASRPAGEVALAWERSDVSDEGPWDPLLLDGNSAFDPTAPTDGSAIWYRACATSPSAEPVCSLPQQGARRVVAPAVELVGGVNALSSSVFVEVRVSSEGSPSATRMGACAEPIDQEGESLGEARCVSLSADTVPTLLTIDDLTPGERYRVTPTVEWLEETLTGSSETTRLLPADTQILLVKDEGDSATLEWAPAEGAVRYEVRRDGELVHTTDGPATTWNDFGIQPGEWDATTLTLQATDDRTDGSVHVTWDHPDAVPGGLHAWTVTALNLEDVAGDESEPESLLMQPAPIVTWELYINDTLTETLDADVLEYLDNNVPLPAVTDARVVQVEPERLDAVVLEALDVITEDGDDVRYRVVATTSLSLDIPGPSVTGKAAASAPGFQWQRSNDETLPTEDEAWTNLTTTEDRLEDEEAPEDRSPRFWRAVVSLESGESFVTDPVSATRAFIDPKVRFTSYRSQSPGSVQVTYTIDEPGAPVATGRICTRRASDDGQVGCTFPFALEAGAQEYTVSGGSPAGAPLVARFELLDADGETYSTLLDGASVRSVPGQTPSLSASDTFRTSTSIRVQWSAVTHATGYVLRRDGEEIGTFSASTTLFNDEEAPRGETSFEDVEVTASDTFPTMVLVSWSGFEASEGPETTYTLSAVNEAGEGPARELTSRTRAPFVQRAEIDWGENFAEQVIVEPGGTFPPSANLTGVPLGEVDFSGVTVSDDRTDGVFLDGQTVVYAAGETVPVRVRFRDNLGNTSDPFETAGNTSPLQPNTRSWQRSESPDGSDPTVLATSETFLDTPPFTAQRWYRYTVRMTGGSIERSTPWMLGVRAFSNPTLVTREPTNLQPLPDSPGTFQMIVSAEVTEAPIPGSTAVEFCLRTDEPPAFPWDPGDCEVTRSATAGTNPVASFLLQAIELGDRWYIRSRGRVQGIGIEDSPWVDGGLVVFDAPIAPVSTLEASEGTHSDAVTVSWTLPRGAVAADVYRDGERVAEAVEGESWTDTEAPEPGRPPAQTVSTVRYFNAAASPDHVDVLFFPATPPVGESAEYRVVAIGASGFRADPSPAVTGFRAALPILFYEISRTPEASDDPDFQPIAPEDLTEVVDGSVTRLRFRDVDAPLHEGTVVFGAQSLNEGVRPNWGLNLTSAEVREAYYRVRAVNAAGAGDNFAAAQGSRRSQGPTEARLYRTTGGEDVLLATSTTVAGASTSGNFLDTLASIDNEEETYRLEWSAPFNVSRTETVSGTRNVHAQSLAIAGAVADGDAPSGWSVAFDVLAVGNPASQEVTLCLAGPEDGNSSPFNPQAECSTFDRPWGPGDTAFTLPGSASYASGTEVTTTLWLPSSPSIAVLTSVLVVP